MKNAQIILNPFTGGKGATVVIIYGGTASGSQATGGR
ncbi:Hypothetical protein PACV_162 [Pacmanvirus A23]|nr:Hypothetical protein B9W72_gp160 [Pacmanvirus A23]SIP85877.1 Hypothetical protein PACV_162 [Pacmanvirus A23]